MVLLTWAPRGVFESDREKEAGSLIGHECEQGMKKSDGCSMTFCSMAIYSSAEQALVLETVL